MRLHPQTPQTVEGFRVFSCSGSKNTTGLRLIKD
jgi:hypothetical protein